MDIWTRLDALIDRAPSEHDLESHGLELLAARRFRAVGRAVPERFLDAERVSAVVLLSVPVLLERVRRAYDGPGIILKGPEVAAHYPDPILRSFGDLDLLVPDPQQVSRVLQAAGFELVGDPDLYVNIHHVRPLAAPGIPIPLELHSAPKWIDGFVPPTAAELFQAAVPGSTGHDGLLALPREQHAVILATHSWAHEPLRRLRDLVDVAAMIDGGDRAAAAAIAEAWGVRRLWESTLAVVDSLFAKRSTPWALRLWAQNLARARERTVLESHVERWLSDFWTHSRSTATVRLPGRLLDEVRPQEDESWAQKLARTTLAVRNAPRRRSAHDRQLDERSSQPGSDQPNG